MATSINFPDILTEIKNGIVDLAKSTVSNYLKEAKKDAQSLLTEMKDDLERWTNLLAQGLLTTEDFEWLVNSEKDTVKMAALEQAGLAAIRIDQFKSSLLNLIVDTVFKAIKI
ncbi:MAG: hypothetical protein JSU03_04835 [Bacteroidetes bacterium]|nr:hypothetical protein [Bacteroidota bacterium]